MFFKISVLLAAALLFLAGCTPSATTKTEKADAPEMVEAAYFEAFIIRDDVQLREAPGEGAPVAARMNDGSKVSVLQNKNGWYEVLNPDKGKGWVRSDYVGPEKLSFGRRASAFTDSVLKRYNATMFIDDNDPYEVIYLVLPEDYYQSKGMARRYATKIGGHYQNHVYPGEVEIRILEHDNKKLFTRQILAKKKSAGYRAPFLRYGRLYDIKLKNASELELTVLIPTQLADAALLAMAREISKGYDLSISMIEIYFVDESDAGLAFLRTGNAPSDKPPCRLYYLEDEAGEDYRFDYCKTP